MSMQYGIRRLVLTSFVRSPVVSASARSLSAVRFSKTGDPYQVLNIDSDVSDKIPKKLRADEIELKMIFSPINSNDVEQIEGRKYAAPSLPAVAGQDGLAEVVSVGPSVKSLSKGDWVVPLPGSNIGTWCHTAYATESHVLQVPKDIPAEYASGIGANASAAYRMLHDIKSLAPGDVIIHSAANSAVGMAILQMAKSIGVKTINVLRSRPTEDHAAETIASVGGDIIVYEEYLHSPDFYDLISDIPAPCLALDAVGGRVGTDMLRALGKNGTLVKYGCLSQNPVEVPQSIVQARGLKIDDFCITKWTKQSKPADRSKMVEDIANMIRKEELIMFFEIHPFSQISNALDRYYEPYKFRKVLMDMSI